jgi:catechol 2,3-dioxygenase-like lactoylglutathione lyase family enzyme
MKAITHIGAVLVPVKDQDAALEFYVGTLGFEKRMDASFGEGMRWIEVAPRGATTSIALVPSPGTHEVSFATDDAAAVHSELLKRGVDADPELLQVEFTPPMFTFRDPDGNAFRMVERG